MFSQCWFCPDLLQTFTRWCNVHLGDRKLKIDDLASDFEDGVKLINLLEVIYCIDFSCMSVNTLV